MEIEIQLTNEPIAEKISPPAMVGTIGAWIEFRGVVRDEEAGQKISALEYEAYPEMAVREIRRLLEEIFAKRPCLAVKVIHRVGIIPVGSTAIYLGVAAQHRAEALDLIGEFMNRLKQDVPIWKRRALPLENPPQPKPNPSARNSKVAILSFEAAISKIQSYCKLLPAIRIPLEESLGRVLRETVCASDDLPDCDRSTRDGYAILKNAGSKAFQVVDVIHAADWKPRELKSGEAVRVATGASLPCKNLRVVMQENVERVGDKIKILRCEDSMNIRERGEDMKAGQPLVESGVRLDARKLALLATAGCAQPLVSPRLRVTHFTTGDEIVPPSHTPKPGQIRDSNSILIRGLLKKFHCDLLQKHLPENFEKAWEQLNPAQIANANVILISGGASVGEKDFTPPLLEQLGFEIIFSQVNVRPGRPLIFGINGSQIAFGLPGNPLSHFVCFHLFVANALSRVVDLVPQKILRGQLAIKLDGAFCPRETFCPARMEFAGSEIQLRPLKWSSSGDVTCLNETNALIRIPINQDSIEVGSEVDFFPTTDILGA